MFAVLISKISQKLFSTEKNKKQLLKILQDAKEAFEKNDIRTAREKYENYLRHEPYDFDALNDLGCCLAAQGLEAEAEVVFDRAYKFNDAYLPTTINYANVLKSRWQTTEALKLIERAKIQDPSFPNSHTVYGAIQFTKGNVDVARKNSLKGWLGQFDSLRLANSYLFNSAYSDIKGEELAAEHCFWAETLRPLDAVDENKYSWVERRPERDDRINIAYWSPDFRNHSVRYFFRSLLEGHDRKKFCITIIHDSFVSDGQTDLIKSAADYYYAVEDMGDEELRCFFKAMDFDFLVELAGHSSNNRLNIFQEKLAKIQLTGIGYPPTTGMSSIDAKIVDRSIAATEDHAGKYYSEELAVLPQSFWCFDPKQEVDKPCAAPISLRGHITYGCFGNISKINARVLGCWGRILKSVPDARLIIISINFGDEDIRAEWSERFAARGIDISRVDLKGPVGGADFFSAYNQIDVVLDTFPFNGGTTSCFASYMGVPILTLVGDSLISRMGLSVMANLGMKDWAVDSEDEYVERAIAASQQKELISWFRFNARDIFQKSAIGNGKIFAMHLEDYYSQALVKKNSGRSSIREAKTVALPADELVERAYEIMRYGNKTAAHRVVDYCLREYPECAAAHIIKTERYTSRRDFSEAVCYIDRVLNEQVVDNRATLLVNAARFCLSSGDYERASSYMEGFFIPSRSEKECLQGTQIISVINNNEELAGNSGLDQSSSYIAVILLVTDSDQEFEQKKSEIYSEACVGKFKSVKFFKIRTSKKSDDYGRLLKDEEGDIFFIVQRNVQFSLIDLWDEVHFALQQADVLSVGGASRWQQMNWKEQDPFTKSGGYIIPSGEVPGFFENHHLGLSTEKLRLDMSVLDGCFLAFKRLTDEILDKIVWDEQLVAALTLFEEYFTYQLSMAGLRLATHHALGVLVDWRISLNEEYLGEARLHLAEKLKFSAFAKEGDHSGVFSVPSGEFSTAVRAQKKFIQLMK